MPKLKPQIHMEDEFLTDEALVTNLQVQLDILEANRQGHLAFAQANRKIQAMMPWDGIDHRWRIGPHVIEVTSKNGGREVEYTTKDGYSVKINPKVKESPAAE